MPEFNLTKCPGTDKPVGIASRCQTCGVSFGWPHPANRVVGSKAPEHYQPVAKSDVIEVIPVEGPWEMVEGYGPHPPMLERCRFCGSCNVESDAFESFGGTTEGYERCNDCAAHVSWCDLSAVR